MEKLVSITIHTERLHDDKVWRQVNSLLKFFRKYKVKATWFSINPTFIGYKYDEKKWIERLNFIKNSGQEIQQHTHFYKGKEGVRKGIGYDLGKENVRERIREDKNWLEKKIGVEPNGFVSGAFKINSEILDILGKEGFKYDLTNRDGFPHYVDGLLEISTIARPKSFLLKPKFIKFHKLYFSTVYFHDYDLINNLLVVLLKLQILFFSFLRVKFISASSLYEKITER